MKMTKRALVLVILILLLAALGVCRHVLARNRAELAPPPPEVSASVRQSRLYRARMLEPEARKYELNLQPAKANHPLPPDPEKRRAWIRTMERIVSGP